jgi:hypothetical protein
MCIIYNMNNNGRVNIMGPNTGDLFQLYDKIPVNDEYTDHKDALVGNWESSVLSKAFFSKENIKIVQNAIKAGVYEVSKGNYTIGNQSEDVLKIIMRSTYLQYSSNKQINITEQIVGLNKLVVDYCVPQLVSECIAYVKYKKDVSSLAVPISRPKSTYHSNTLEFKNFF